MKATRVSELDSIVLATLIIGGITKGKREYDAGAKAKSSIPVSFVLMEGILYLHRCIERVTNVVGRERVKY